MTLKEEIEHRILQSEEDMRDNPQHWTGGDWWQLEPKEEFVFAIERERWPRMMSAWLFFEVLHQLADVGDDEAPVRLLHEEGARRPDIDYSRAGFDLFAAEYAGLTLREADATFSKMHFSNIRQGIVEYKDDDAGSPIPPTRN